MAVVRVNAGEVSQLARLIRAEAEGEGDIGMLLVGNVGVNRVRGNCLDFRGIRTISQMIYQSPGGFEAVQKGYFYQRAREREKRLARKVINGYRASPAEFALWFYKPGTPTCTPTFFNQFNSGRFKSHCFYTPSASNCPKVYSV